METEILVNENFPCFNEMDLSNDHPFWKTKFFGTKEAIDETAKKFNFKAVISPFGSKGSHFQINFLALYVVAAREKNRKWREIGRVCGSCAADASTKAEQFFGVDSVFILKDWKNLKLKV